MTLSTQEKQNEEGQKNPNLLFDDEFLNKWYRSKEPHASHYRYYVVYKGHQPGIYDNWEDAQKRRISGGGHVAPAGLSGAVTLKGILDRALG